MQARITVVGASRRDIDELLRLLGATVTSVPDLAGVAATPGEPPAVVLLDLRGTGRVPPSVAEFTARYPAIPVVIVAASLDAVMMRDAINAGTRGVVNEPLTPQDLEAALARVSAPAASARQPGKILAFIGAKGGVGTTTLAVNVGAAVAQMTKAGTLFIDLNARYADATAYLGAEPRFTVSDALENAHKLDMPFMQGLVVRTSADMDLLAGPARPLPGSATVPRLRALLEFAKREYPYTVLDLPHTEDVVLDALDHTTTIVVVVSQEVTAVRNAARIVTPLRQRYGQERVQIAIGRFDRVAEISDKDVEKALGGVVRVFTSDFRQALESLNCGRPLVLNGNSRLAGEVKRFVREFAPPAPKEAPPPHESRLPKWLTLGRT
jgi:pilus assembly protein CpaE